jgi:hypothetical protein
MFNKQCINTCTLAIHIYSIIETLQSNVCTSYISQQGARHTRSYIKLLTSDVNEFSEESC